VTRAPGAALASLLLAAGAAGCITVGGGGGPPAEQRSFDLQPPLPSATPAEGDGPEVLWIEPFTADPALDRDEIVWRRGSVESGAYERYRWVRPPAIAARALLADALARGGVCAVAATEPRVAKPDYALRAHLVRFEEVEASGGWAGAVEVRVALFRASDGAEVLRRAYARTEPAPQRNPAGVVEALRKGLDGISEALVADVRKALGHERKIGAHLSRDDGPENDRLGGFDPPPPDWPKDVPMPPDSDTPTPRDSK
jgi:ABC-type uncharacterized transport system auxiliary subunit